VHVRTLLSCYITAISRLLCVIWANKYIIPISLCTINKANTSRTLLLRCNFISSPQNIPVAPPYLSDLLQYHEPMRSLRSSSFHQLSVSRHNLTFGSHAFRFSAPRVWNSLPVSIRETKSLPTFRRHLKTTIFSQSILIHLSILPRYIFRPRALILPKTWRYTSHLLLTYLLTYLFAIETEIKAVLPVLKSHQ